MKIVSASFLRISLSLIALGFVSCDEKKEEASSSGDSSASQVEAPAVENETPSAAFLQLKKKLQEVQGQPDLLKRTLSGMKPEGTKPPEYLQLINEYAPDDGKERLIGRWFYYLAKDGLQSVQEGYALLQTPEDQKAALKNVAMPLRASDPVAYFKWLKSLGEEKFITDAVNRSLSGVGTPPKNSDLNAYLARLEKIESLELNEKQARRVFSSLIFGLGKGGLIDQSFLKNNLDRFPELLHGNLYAGYIKSIPPVELMKTYHSLKLPEKIKGSTDSAANVIVAKNSTLDEALTWVEQYPKDRRSTARVKIFMTKGVEGKGEHALAVLQAIESKSTFRFVSKYLKRRLSKMNPELGAEIEKVIQERGDQ